MLSALVSCVARRRRGVDLPRSNRLGASARSKQTHRPPPDTRSIKAGAVHSFQYPANMALSANEIVLLDARARAVGESIGWELHFQVAPNPEFVGLTAGANHIFVVGPALLADLAAHDIDLTLDALERRERRIVEDEDGDPRLV